LLRDIATTARTMHSVGQPQAQRCGRRQEIDRMSEKSRMRAMRDAAAVRLNACDRPAETAVLTPALPRFRVAGGGRSLERLAWPDA
jgi:hypothetical protein